MAEKENEGADDGDLSLQVKDSFTTIFINMIGAGADDIVRFFPGLGQVSYFFLGNSFGSSKDESQELDFPFVSNVKVLQQASSRVFPMPIAPCPLSRRT